MAIMSFASFFLLLLSVTPLGYASQQSDTLGSETADAMRAAGCPGSLGRRDSVPSEYVAAPYYPTPKGGWVSNWTDAYAKAEIIVAEMTLAEKVNLTSGTGQYMVSHP